MQIHLNTALALVLYSYNKTVNEHLDEYEHMI